jgi:transposase IS116/IS110/IS902 family protein
LGGTRTLRSLYSQPGLGQILGARVLGEFGDDPDRYTGAQARKNYAGNSPITRASGKKKTVLARHVRNRRLADPLHQQAFCALTTSPGARAYYDKLCARGTSHHAHSASSATASSASCTAA